jgi:hypothetical protein
MTYAHIDDSISDQQPLQGKRQRELTDRFWPFGDRPRLKQSNPHR